MKYLILLILFSCASNEAQDSVTKPNLKVSDTIKMLESEMKKDENGWPVSDSCDAMLWSGLYAFVNQDIDLSAAEVNGEFFRNPNMNCYPNNSKSSWSRDMALGLFHGLIAKKDVDALQRHIELGKENNWIMGSGVKSRTVYNPSFISLTYQISDFLGVKHSGNPIIPNIYESPIKLEDYQYHLQMLDIHLRGVIKGEITDLMLRAVKRNVDRFPTSIFFEYLKAKYTDGDFTRSIELCLNNKRESPSFVRCDNEQCDKVERLFGCYLVNEVINKE